MPRYKVAFSAFISGPHILRMPVNCGIFPRSRNVPITAGGGASIRMTGHMHFEQMVEELGFKSPYCGHFSRRFAIVSRRISE